MASSLDYFKRMGSPVAALATATGGPVLVIRISGRDLSALAKLCDLPEAGKFELKKIFSGDGRVLDHGLILFFQAPHSFTGENVVELQIHGALPLAQEIFRHLELLGIQQALPGEFSFRAVMNQKMTLEQAEALNFVLKSDNLSLESSRELLGMRKISNQVTDLIHHLIVDLQRARGRVEAAIDFPEAETEQAREIESARKILTESLSSLVQFQNAYRNFRTSNEVPLVGIVGSPNAGKSTLLNLLAGGEKAIVSPIPGTTRDLVEVELRLLSGQKIRLIDTAGLRAVKSLAGDPHSSLEELGIQRSLGLLKDCRILIWVKNAAEVAANEPLLKEIQSFKHKILEVYSHADQVAVGDDARSFNFIGSDSKELRSYILGELNDRIQNSLDRPSENSHNSWLSERQAREIALVEDKVRTSLGSLEGRRPLELVGCDLRDAEKGLLEVIGQDLGEEYISQIFSQFCLGK